MSHIAIRSCVACRGKFPKRDLLRIVRTPDGKVILDRTGKTDGRGMYWCGSEKCLDRIRKKGLVEKMLKVKEPKGLIDELEGVIDDKITG